MTLKLKTSKIKPKRSELHKFSSFNLKMLGHEGFWACDEQLVSLKIYKLDGIISLKCLNIKRLIIELKTTFLNCGWKPLWRLVSSLQWWTFSKRSSREANGLSVGRKATGRGRTCYGCMSAHVRLWSAHPPLYPQSVNSSTGSSTRGINHRFRKHQQLFGYFWLCQELANLRHKNRKSNKGTRKAGRTLG